MIALLQIQITLGNVKEFDCKLCRIEYQTGAETTCQELYSTLVGIQTGTIEDKMGWTVEIC